MSIMALVFWLLVGGSGCSSVNPYQGDSDIDWDADLPIPEICPDGIYEGDYDVTDEESLRVISGCEVVTGDLNVRETKLANIDDLRALGEVSGNLKILDNLSLTDLRGLSKLRVVGDELSIAGNPTLHDLDGLQALTSVSKIEVYSNPVLVNVDGLNGLTHVTAIDPGDARVSIRISDGLIDLSGLRNIEVIDGALVIERNPLLVTLDGLDNLTSVLEINISSNDSLTSLESLSGLSSLEHGLNIWDNDTLTNLHGLENLSTVGEILVISRNDSLLNLDALGSMSFTGDVFEIEDNTSLPTCEAQGLLDRLLEEGWDGGVTIRVEGNLPDECS